VYNFMAVDKLLLQWDAVMARLEVAHAQHHATGSRPTHTVGDSCFKKGSLPLHRLEAQSRLPGKPGGPLHSYPALEA
jgi:hypothetical protein